MKSRMLSLIISALLISLDAFNQNIEESGRILGIWLTGSKKGKVEIYKCGEEFCGKIIWLRDPLNDEGKPKKDDKNPDKGLRDRLIIGTNVLHGFIYDGDLEWDDGEIYDPDNGKTYSCVMNLQPGGKVLEVRGYIGISLIGRTEEWIKSSLD
ncbi:MAG: DUF2147 domain-containing protein [Vicingaceae bacterium]